MTIKSRIFNDEQVLYIIDHLPGRTRKSLLNDLNNRFNETFTHNQLDGFISRNKLKSGVDGTFKKGSIPWNKEKKGWCAKGTEKTWFKKGRRSENYRPVGSERVDAYGYVEVKVSHDTWDKKHRVLWEEYHGTKVKEGEVVAFVDGDKSNLAIENLRKIDRGTLAIWNHNYNHLKNQKADDPTLALSQLKHMVGEKRG